MKLLNILSRNKTTTDFYVISHFEQILNALKTSSLKDKKEVCRIVSEIKNHLNYNEVESLVKLSCDLTNGLAFLSVMEKERPYWENNIKSVFIKDIEDAKLSLCTSDFLAFIIGKKHEVFQLKNLNGYWSNAYHEIEQELNKILIESNLLCDLEANQKEHIPVNYALSMFLLYDTKTALVKFKRIVNNDRAHRLEDLHQAEYFLIFEKFFARIKIDFIPKIDFSNYLTPIEFENNNNKYITKVEIKNLINKEDYFKKRGFSIDKKFLLKPDNIRDKTKLKELYFTFFNYFNNKVSRHYIDVLYSCFTETNPQYEDHQIAIVRTELTKIIDEKKITKELIYFSYYLVTNQLETSNEKIKHLTNGFFNTNGLSLSTISNVFSDRFDKNLSYNTELPKIYLIKST